MKIFSKKQVTIAPHLKVWVSNHYSPNLFGIRGKYESSYKSGQYVECGSPGTGFFVRNGSSQSYKAFCKKQRAKLQHTYWDMLMGREFDFDKEIERVNQALEECGKNDFKVRILESYANVLPLAKEAEQCERYIDGLKQLSHRRHKLTSYQSHVLTNIKSRIARLGHDIRSLQILVPTEYGEEKYKHFGAVVVAFSEMTSSHRIWHAKLVTEETKLDEELFSQVFFDLGIFNFIQAPLMTPVMRDGQGNKIYWYPDFIVVARDAVDFDVIPICDIDFHFNETRYDIISSQVLTSYSNEDDGTATRTHRRSYEDYGEGLLVNKDTVDTHNEEHHSHERMVGEIYIKKAKMRFYIRDLKASTHFYRALADYQDYYRETFLK